MDTYASSRVLLSSIIGNDNVSLNIQNFGAGIFANIGLGQNMEKLGVYS